MRCPSSPRWSPCPLRGAARPRRPARRSSATSCPRARQPAFALRRLAANLGYAAGPAAAGVLAGHAFPLLFAGDAATSLAFGAIVLLRLPRDRPAAPPARARGGFLRAARRDGTVVRLLAAVLAIHLVYWQQLATLPLVVTGRGLPAAAYGLLLSVNGLVVILCELPLTAVTRRLAPRRAIALGFLLIGAGFALLAAAGTLAALVACVLVWTLGEMIWDPVASAYLATLAPPHLRGRYQGAFSATVASAYVVAPALGGTLYARSPVALWLLCGALGVAAAAIVVREA